MRLFRDWLGVLPVVLNPAVPDAGQETTATVAGLVSDPSGAVVINAEISVVNLGTNATCKTTTNTAGN